jgi:hypothetical protein
MKAHRRIARNLGLQTFEFVPRRPLNSLRVEISQGGVVIRASRDNFPPHDKDAFVHYLAEEGFIPEWYRNFSATQGETWTSLQWVVDKTYHAQGSGKIGAIRGARRFVARLLAYEVLVWLIQLVALFLTIQF